MKLKYITAMLGLAVATSTLAAPAFNEPQTLSCWNGHGKMSITVYEESGRVNQPVYQHIYYRIEGGGSNSPVQGKVYVDSDRPGANGEQRVHQEWPMWVTPAWHVLGTTDSHLDARSYPMPGRYQVKLGIKMVSDGAPSPECYLTGIGYVNIS